MTVKLVSEIRKISRFEGLPPKPPMSRENRIRKAVYTAHALMKKEPIWTFVCKDSKKRIIKALAIIISQDLEQKMPRLSGSETIKYNLLVKWIKGN